MLKCIVATDAEACSCWHNVSAAAGMCVAVRNLVWYKATLLLQQGRLFLAAAVHSGLNMLLLLHVARIVCRRSSFNDSIGWGPRLKEAWREISAVLHIRTFQIIILQVLHACLCLNVTA